MDFKDIPGGFAAAFDPPPAAAFSRSTSCFHFFTISFANSDTCFEECARSFPTASPALLSYKSDVVSTPTRTPQPGTYPENGLGDLRMLLEGLQNSNNFLWNPR